ncbi:MAG: hypothetical protein ACRD4Z_02000, partial [Nitrososphaeraceae archaeon]
MFMFISSYFERFGTDLKVRLAPLIFFSCISITLSELEQLLLLSTMGGITGWHFAIMRHKKYAPYLSNYCNSPAGRTFPSAAGFITSEIFYIDDDGTYFFPTRDFHPPLEIVDGKVDLQEFLSAHKTRIRKLSNKRLY